MLVLIGPSASGKTESAKIMINRYPISRVVTCTTRKKRINEIDGFDYHFFSIEEFNKLKEELAISSLEDILKEEFLGDFPINLIVPKHIEKLES